MNLAPIKYKKILQKDGGPIKKITVQKIGTVHEAYAYLEPTLRNEAHLVAPLVYDPVDGTGTHANETIAIYKAISEAMERWAFYALKNSAMADTFGFNIDPTTSGMAAFPGLTKLSARRSALQEAIERFSVRAWWNLEISHVYSNAATAPDQTRLIHLEQTWRTIHVVILKASSPLHQAHCYAFAAGQTTQAAIARANVELNRNQRAIDRFYSAHHFNPNQPFSVVEQNIKNHHERRLIYFSTDEGNSTFQTRLSTDARPHKYNHLDSPRILIDRAVMGPWSKYSHVWRVVFEPPGKIENEYDHTFFIF